MSQINYKELEQIVTRIYNRYIDCVNVGKVASYIPTLKEVDPNQYAISVATIDGKTFDIGDYNTPFTIQSISKVFTLAMISPLLGDHMWNYVGREPSGNSFNSLVQLENEKGIPRNPFINAGALVITDRLLNYFKNNDNPELSNRARTREAILQFVRKLSGSDNIVFDKITRNKK